VKSKKGIVNELVNVGIFDHTAEASLTLWGPTTNSAAPWKPSTTVLLLSNPGWRIDRRAWISLTSNTIVDVDPDMPDADWLRTFAQRMTRREHVNPPFPEAVFDFEAMSESVNQILYTFSDIDEFARAAPNDQFFGFLSVVITELNVMKLYRRNMLLCNECCGIPIFNNSVITKCKQCEKSIRLGINPCILGPVVDETGCSSTGKILFGEKAWEELLGRTADELVQSSVDVLKYLEQRLLYLRVTLRFAWAAEPGEGGMGRLCVWDVMM
jgi:hypothetical protein